MDMWCQHVYKVIPCKLVVWARWQHRLNPSRAFGSIIRFPVWEGLFFSMAEGSTGESDGSSAAYLAECPVQAAWNELPGVLERVASKGRICHLGPGGVTRQCVIDNVDIIEPLIKSLGTLI